ncbi:MAG: hypothetical protein ACKVZJ_14570 [Phycisphaerales bacterium]
MRRSASNRLIWQSPLHTPEACDQRARSVSDGFFGPLADRAQRHPRAHARGSFLLTDSDAARWLCAAAACIAITTLGAQAIAQTNTTEGWIAFRLPPSPDELAASRAMLNQVGPIADPRLLDRPNHLEQSAIPSLCSPDAISALETALPTAWTHWGDAFFSRPDAAAGRWLQDQGCFNIIACAGSTTPEYRFRTPLAFDHTSSLPAFKVCGFLSNFNAPQPYIESLGDVPPNPSGDTFTPGTNCAFYDTQTHPVTNNWRDQDVIMIRVPAPGLENFRLFVTAAQEFEVILYCNKNFPWAGDINSCWVDPAQTDSPPAEFGWVASFNGDKGMTNPNTPPPSVGPEGAINQTWAFPRNRHVFLPEGTYLVNVRLKPFAALQPPMTPTPPNTCYQVQIVGNFPTPPTCPCFFDLADDDCAVNVRDLTRFLGQFGKTCAQIAPAACADHDNNGVVNITDLTAFLGEFGKSGNATPGSCQ